jgi:glycosyltransferase involved in cell wall biosynthesis
MHKICGSLSKHGYAVTLIGRELKNSVPLNKKPFEQIRLKCFFNKGKLFYAEYNLRLFLFLLFKKYDAACAIDLDTIAAVYLASATQLNAPKLIYDAHEFFTEVPEVIRRPTVKKMWMWVERTFVPKFNLTYTVSPALAELFEKKYNIKVGVIMNAPKLQKQNVVAQAKEPFTILYQGALNEGRGLEHLIESMKDIDANLLLAGEGDLSEQLRLKTKQLNLENKVKFLGHVQPDKLREITSAVYIGVNLLENKGLSYYYSLSNKFFDYAHANVPQLCIGFPEYKTLNNEFEIAVLLNDCTVTEIKFALQRILSDKTLYERLQKNCADFSSKYNWQNEEQKLIEMYEQLFR